MGQTIKLLLLTLLFTVVCVTKARADSIQIILTNPSQTGNPGQTLQFFGSIINIDPNSSDAPIYFNLDSLNLSLTDASTNDLFFTNVPVDLPVGASSGPIELFDVTLASPESSPFGIYSGTYALLGGMDGGANTAQNILGQTSFFVNAQSGTAAVTPEPPTLPLAATGLVVICLVQCRRRLRKNLMSTNCRGHLNATSTLIICAALFHNSMANAQHDPGPRPGASDAGVPFEKLNATEVARYWAARDVFKEVNSVSGSIERGVGLGPTFNGNSCAGCHAQPAAGGSSPGPGSHQVSQLELRQGRLVLVPQTNPQTLLATLDRAVGHDQRVPAFLTQDGPVRVARVISKPDGTPDGNVYGIYTIAGRRDAPGCQLVQPDFDREMANHNLSYRIPTPIFGGGLIESIPDSVLQANFDKFADLKRVLGIGGRFNRAMNEGTINRFGWKAQGKSLLMFAAESYSIEEGVTNEFFPNERSSDPYCQFNKLPEDTIRVQPLLGATDQALGFASDVVNFGEFMRLLAPPRQVALSDSAMLGSKLFESVGCALCHSPSLRTGMSQVSGMSKYEIQPYSDFALHHMGPGLSDHISQGIATGDEFRTAPLWGLGQRLFFLHDGRTSDLVTAIETHKSDGKGCLVKALGKTLGESCRSEANAVIIKFNDLSIPQKQQILDFLRSL